MWITTMHRFFSSLEHLQKVRYCIVEKSIEKQYAEFQKRFYLLITESTIELENIS